MQDVERNSTTVVLSQANEEEGCWILNARCWMVFISSIQHQRSRIVPANAFHHPAVDICQHAVGEAVAAWVLAQRNEAASGME